MWITELSPEANKMVLRSLSQEVLQNMSQTPLRDQLAELIANDNYEGLVLFSLPSYDSISVMDALYARQVLAFFQKNATLDIGVDCEQVARDTWLKTESVCRETNVRFRASARGDVSNMPSSRVSSVLYAAQCKIAKVLGPRVPKLKDLELVFGPGATQSVKKKNACARTKLSAGPSCSTNMLGLLPELLATWPHYCDLHGVEEDRGDPEYVIVRCAVEIADGRLGFVPKNAKTHRTVLVEPHLNGVVQGGYGRFISDRLRGVGIDLSDQSRNQRLARIGSLTGELATLDLSSASDLISTEVVASLLPVDWFLALNECRTPVAVDGKSSHKLEKFSSMGNGFTFPLQSLIFWALCAACQETFEDARKVSVYGDDIIVPVDSVPLVHQVFDYCGFSINLAKSYWSGPFRESCGGDYYNGVNIRPYYIKDNCTPKTLFSLHNYYVRAGFDDLAKGVRAYISDDVALYGPDGFGDGHLLGEWHPRQHRRDQGWSGWLFDTYKEFGSKHKTLLPGDFILPAYTVYVSNPEQWEAFTYDVLAGRLWAVGHTEGAVQLPKDRGGVPHLALPGAGRYKRVTLYTLSR